MPVPGQLNSGIPADSNIATPDVIAVGSYQGVAIDASYQPKLSILVGMEGSPWVVNLYLEILDKDNAASGQQITKPANLQQYELIKNFVFKVKTPVSVQYDASQGTVSGTGAANVYGVVAPNVGAMFTASIADGREGIFQITSVEPLSYFKNKVYAVEYTLIDYATEVRMSDLAKKVVRTKIFVESMLHYNQDPCLETSEYDQLQQLMRWYNQLTRYYFKAFFSTELRVLLVPGMSQPTYDPFMVKFLLQLVSSQDAEEIQLLRVLNVDEDSAYLSSCVLDAILQQDPSLYQYGFQKQILTDVFTFSPTPIFEGARFSGVSLMVYPGDPVQRVDFTYSNQTYKTSSGFQLHSNYPSVIGTYDTTPLITSVSDNPYYLFSQAFYTAQPYGTTPAGTSVLEGMVLNYLNGSPVNKATLLACCENIRAWSHLDQFYVIPILIAMIKVSIPYV